MHSYRSLYTIALATIFLVSFQFMSATWIAPTAVPPGDNVPAPLNVGETTQSKIGNLNAYIFQARSAMWSDQYCDVVGENCFTPTNRTGLPTCANGQTLVADATGTWVCGAPSPTIPPVAWLVNEQHSESQCTALGGTVMTEGSNRFCRFARSSCPTGWAQYQNWSQTVSRSCSGSSCGGFSSAPYTCAVSGHSFSNQAPSTCLYDTSQRFGMGEGPDGHKGCNRSTSQCVAPISEIGCY